MTPWFIATEPFTPEDKSWTKYIDWSGLKQLDELVSLDPILCPSVLKEVKDNYWPHIVNEAFMLPFFVDFDFLKTEIEKIEKKNVLCVFRNPTEQPTAPPVARFEFLGYDLVDFQHSASALTNCGGFADVFDNSELSHFGLIPELKRALEIQRKLSQAYPEEVHAQCHLWAVFRIK